MKNKKEIVRESGKVEAAPRVRGPDDALAILIKEPGYAVISFPGICYEKLGDELSNFGNGYARAYRIKMLSATNKADWNRQFKQLFPNRRDPNVYSPKSTFFRCEIIPRESAPARDTAGPSGSREK